MIKKEWLIVASLTFLTIVCWVIFDILHSRSQVEISPKLQEVIEPISPDFNTKSLNESIK